MNKSSLLYGPLFYDEIRILKEYANDEPFSDFYVFENSDTIRFLKPPTERFIHKPIEQNLPFDISSVLLTVIVSGITFCAALTDEIRRKKPKYALCGHVHTGNHNITACPIYDYVFQEETEWTNVRVANVSILDESYSIYFKPTTFEL